MQRTILTLCLVSGVLLLLSGVYLVLDLVSQRRTAVSDAKEGARQQAVDTAKGLDEELERYAKLADDLASEISTERPSHQELAQRLKRDLEANPNLHSIGAAYAPSAQIEGRKLFAPYWERREGELHLLQLEDSFDTTSADNTWFVEAMAGEADWREPVWDDSRQTVTATYSAPFAGAEGDEGQGAAGVVWLSLSMVSVEKRLRALELGSTGFAGLLSREGYALVFPSAAMVRNRVSFFDLPDVSTDPNFRAAVESATRGESGSTERENRLTGQSSWIFWEPVVESGWSMFVVLIKDEIPVDRRASRRRIIWIILNTVFGLTLIATAVCIRFRQRYPHNAILWGLVAFTAILMWTGIVVIRNVVFQQPSDDGVDHVVILDRSGLDAYLATRVAGSAGDGYPTRHIPTGVYLQSMKLVASNEVFVTGYVWQKHDAAGSTDSEPGFILPDATNPRITEAYRYEENRVETVGWYIETTLRQNLNTSRYPLDHCEVSIRFEPTGLNPRLLLVPDLDAYDTLHPAARPGLDEKLLVAGWKVLGSTFDYKSEKYDSSLGIPGRISGTVMEGLNFNVRIQRYTLDVIISTCIPLIIVVIMLFAVLASATRNEEEAKLFGFNPSGVMKVGSALFFVVLLAHIQLRSRIEVQQVVLMEYVFFVVYLVVLLVSLHSFLFSLERYNKGRLGYRDGLVQKLLFWPLLSGALLLIMIFQFY